MITREQIHELAKFEDEGACALSFYFQPTAPRNKAHKEEAILTKDLAREALRQLESRSSQGKSKNKSKDKCESARADLDRIMRLSQELRGNGAHAKAVFACARQGFWREYDLPAHLSGTQLVVDRHFHLKPLAQLLGALPSLGIVLVDRHRARLFDLRLGELTEREGFSHPLTRRGLSQARSSGRGVTGLRRVLRSLESGEVQTLLVGQSYHSQAVECAGCGHLDAHLVSFCPVCGRETRAVVDVAEAILPRVISHNIELFYVDDDAEFDKVGNIAALLRFRSEQNDNSSNVRPINEAPPNPSVSRRAGLVGRYRGLSSGSA